MTSRATVRRRPASTGEHRATRPTLAREDRRDYRTDDAAPDDDPDAPTGDDPSGPAITVEAALARVARAVDAAVALDLGPHDDADLARYAAGLQRQIDRLTARRDLLAGTLRRRAVSRSAPGTEQRAVQQATKRLATDLKLTPSEAKRASDAGRTLADAPELATAAQQGTLRPEQTISIGRTLRDAPPEVRDHLRTELTAAAKDLDAVQLGRLGRRRLAELDQQAAVDAEDRRHARRRASVAATAEGTVELTASLSGLDAEVACTAIDAFRTPDTAGGPGRTPQQRTADALVAALRAALDLGTAPANRRVRPHLVITVSDDDLAAGTGTVKLPWTGPQPTRSVRRIAGDATVHVVGLDRLGLPISMSKATTHPTAALYLALSYRDGGCRYPGCDAPATWCDVAHATARRDQGPVTLANTLLLCRRHHRKLDTGGWAIVVDGADATFTRSDGLAVRAGPPRGDRGPSPDPDPGTGCDPDGGTGRRSVRGRDGDTGRDPDPGSDRGPARPPPDDP